MIVFLRDVFQVAIGTSFEDLTLKLADLLQKLLKTCEAEQVFLDITKSQKTLKASLMRPISPSNHYFQSTATILEMI